MHPTINDLIRQEEESEYRAYCEVCGITPENYHPLFEENPLCVECGDKVLSIHKVWDNK